MKGVQKQARVNADAIIHVYLVFTTAALMYETFKRRFSALDVIAVVFNVTWLSQLQRQYVTTTIRKTVPELRSSRMRNEAVTLQLY